MDSSKLILTGVVSPPMPLDHLSGAPVCEPSAKRGLSEADHFSDERKRQIAKDFESVLLSKLLDEMKNTVGSWGFEKDGASEQVQGIFWMYLARDIADKGGLALWKDIYRFLTDSNRANTEAESLDKNI